MAHLPPPSRGRGIARHWRDRMTEWNALAALPSSNVILGQARLLGASQAGDPARGSYRKLY